MMRMVALAVLAACGSPAAPAPDASPAPTSFSYRLGVGLEGTRNLPLTIWIDGVQTSAVMQSYDESQIGTIAHHTIELRYQDTVIVSREVNDALAPCWPGDDLVTFDTGLGALSSGEIRAEATDITGTHSGCAYDAGGADCWPGTTQRCAPVIELDTPRFTRLAWVTAGTKQHGEACTFTPDPAGAYDDCGQDLFCYQGACHALCLDSVGPVIDGYAPEVRLCD